MDGYFLKSAVIVVIIPGLYSSFVLLVYLDLPSQALFQVLPDNVVFIPNKLFAFIAKSVVP